MEKTMDKIVSLAKARGFVYPGSEIYGGLANTWDYGNLGVELKNNVKRAWWQKFVQENPYNVGVDCAILMNPQTWVASGHLGGFSDPLMDCKSCKERFRADKLIEDYMADNGIEIEGSVDAWSPEEMKAYVDEHNICCPSCGKHDFTDIRQFNLMFKTFQGVTEDAKNTVYLRPETCLLYTSLLEKAVYGEILLEPFEERTLYSFLDKLADAGRTLGPVTRLRIRYLIFGEAFHGRKGQLQDRKK